MVSFGHQHLQFRPACATDHHPAHARRRRPKPSSYEATEALVDEANSEALAKELGHIRRMASVAALRIAWDRDEFEDIDKSSPCTTGCVNLPSPWPSIREPAVALTIERRRRQWEWLGWAGSVAGSVAGSCACRVCSY